MKILNIKVLRGPNYWSIYRKNLIHLQIDIGNFELLPSNLLENFTERLLSLIPSLDAHHCSLNQKGGFVQKLKKGTWLGHIIEHVALELQELAGMHTTFGRTRGTNSIGVYNVIFSYEIEDAGVYAANVAFKIVETLAYGNDYYLLEEDIEALGNIFYKESLGISTKAIVDEALARDIPYARMGKPSLILLGQGMYQKKIWAAVTSQTGAIGSEIASDKELTKFLLKQACIPVPQGCVLEKLEDLDNAITQIGFPFVIKPINGNHGRNVTTNIHNKEIALEAFYLAKTISHYVILEPFILGHDYRFLVVNFNVIAVAKRLPPLIIGDDKSNIQQLIDNINNETNRGVGHTNFLTKIVIDEITNKILKENHLTLNSILPLGKNLYLKYAANLSVGGMAIDVTDQVHPNNIFLAERAARILSLDICGVDVVTPDIEKPITSQNGAIIEINSSPGLRMHLSPSYGKKRPVAKKIVDMLYPPQTPARIPIIAVTGTNGKTTTVRLIAYLANIAGYKVGFTSTDGIYINNQLITEGDCGGPLSAKVVLQDPTVNFAVLECARGGILRSGLGFDRCNIGVVLNVTGDHLGIGGVDTIEQLAQVKSVIACSTSKNGYSILNADDDLVYAMRHDVNGQVALFSLSSTNERIIEHCNQGGLAIYLDRNEIILQEYTKKINYGSINTLPITFNGAAKCMYPNVLVALLTAAIYKFDIQNIFQPLQNFFPTPENTPGRMNLFDFEKFKVLIDYGHNVGAYQQMQLFLDNVKATKIVGIIAVPGDRRIEDFQIMGYYAAQMFDEIIIRYEKAPRGRTHDQVTGWIKEGIDSANLNKKLHIIPDEMDALKYAMQNAPLKSYIVHFPTNIFEAINYLVNMKKTLLPTLEGISNDT